MQRGVAGYCKRRAGPWSPQCCNTSWRSPTTASFWRLSPLCTSSIKWTATCTPPRRRPSFPSKVRRLNVLPGRTVPAHHTRWPLSLFAEYDNLSGPWFTISFTVAVRQRAAGSCPRRILSFLLLVRLQGVVLPSVAGRCNRAYLLAVMLLLWSLMTGATAWTTTYWQVALVRVGLGLAQAGCTPFAAGLISAYFPPNMKGTAMSVYNVGMYAGAAPQVVPPCIPVCMLKCPCVARLYRLQRGPECSDKSNIAHAQLAGEMSGCGKPPLARRASCVC